MSVYTVVTSDEMADFLRCYDVGSLESYEGINEGIENTNYFVNTNARLDSSEASERYVLTIFEWQKREEIPYFLDLMSHLSNRGIPCPKPVADRQGAYLQTLQGKPAALISRLPGHTLQKPQSRHFEQVGVALAKMHEAAEHFPEKRQNQRDWHWCSECAGKILPSLGEDDTALLHEELRHHRPASAAHSLPRGIIHADLFMDNVLFEEERLTGIIDVYYACDDELLYDLAITVNAWCSDATGSLDESGYAALVGAYTTSRPFPLPEEKIWQDALRRAALRFWLSRLYDACFQKPGHITHVKDPVLYRNILLHRRAGVPPLC